MIELRFNKSLYQCWQTANESISLNPLTFTETFNNDTVLKTFDYSTWFSTSKPTQCPITQLNFTFSPLDVQVAFVPSTTTFTVNFPGWFADATVPVNQFRVFNLTATSSPYVYNVPMELRFNKTIKPCWSDFLDNITLSLPQLVVSYNNDTLKTTYNYSTWFNTTNHVNCPISTLNFFFTGSNVFP